MIFLCESAQDTKDFYIDKHCREAFIHFCHPKIALGPWGRGLNNEKKIYETPLVGKKMFFLLSRSISLVIVAYMLATIGHSVTFGLV